MVISIEATPDEGYSFNDWTCTDGTLADAAAFSTTFTMPAGSASITANFTYNQTNPVNQAPTAKNPVPTQYVTPGDTFTFKASDIALDVDGDPLTITHIVTTPDSAVAVIALDDDMVSVTGVAPGSTFVDVSVSDGTDSVEVTVPIEVMDIAVPTYTLTISTGKGGTIIAGSSGSYPEGTVISIAAWPSAHYIFGGWTSTGGGTFADTGSADTTFTMPMLLSL
jgi:hypothetical protein